MEARYFSPQGIKINIKNFPKNTTIFNTVNSFKLIEVLSDYYIAIQFPSVITLSENNAFTKEKLYYAAAGKIFDYIEARNKVIICDVLFQKWLLNRYNFAINIELSNPLLDIVDKLKNIELYLNLNENENALKNIVMQNQIPRLIHFYQTLS